MTADVYLVTHDIDEGLTQKCFALLQLHFICGLRTIQNCGLFGLYLWQSLFFLLIYICIYIY